MKPPENTPSGQPSSRPGRGEDSVLDWARDLGEADRVIGDLDRLVRRRRRWRAGVGALFLVAGLALWQPWRSDSPPSLADAGAVNVLRPTVQTFADGTVAELHEGAAVEVDYSATLRRVILQQGKAHFQVAKEAQRMFVVTAGAVEVRALGTAFVVEVASQTIDVMVTEGRVAVAPAVAASPGRPPVSRVETEAFASLEAGGRLVVEQASIQGTAPAPQVSVLAPRELQQQLAWRVPRLHFTDTPLDRAVAMFNEFASTSGGARLVLGDPRLAAVRVSGVLRADDTEALLRLLRGDFGIETQVQGRDVVLSKP